MVEEEVRRLWQGVIVTKVSFVEGYVHQNFKFKHQQVPKVAAKKKFASKMRSIVSAVKVAQRLEVRN